MFTLRAETRVGALAVDASLEVPPGTCLALAGPSGAGKTTLLRIAAGLTRPAGGRVTCDGITWLDTDGGVDLPPERRRAGFVFQDYALFPHLSARDNVAFAVRARSRRERRARADELLDSLGMAPAAGRRPGRLSGGERQRVAVARALASDPAVLLLDEPLSALDSRTRAHAARELAAALDAAGVPALLVTHDFADAATLGDEVAVLDRGRVVQRGPAHRLAAEPASAFVADFTGAAVLTGDAGPGPEGLTAIALDGGGTAYSTDAATGRVGVTLFPSDVALEPPGTPAAGSPRNHLAARVVAVTPLGNRTRVGLATPQPLTAELTAASAERLGVRPGLEVVATWKATATRLVPL